MKCPKCGQEMRPRKTDDIIEFGLSKEEVILARRNWAKYFKCKNCKGKNLNRFGNTVYLLIKDKLYEFNGKIHRWVCFSDNGIEKVVFT